MYRFFAGSLGREFVEAFARILIVRKGGLQVFVVIVLIQLRPKRSESRLGISHEAVIDLGPPAQLLSTDVNLNNGGILGKKLLIRKICPDHQQKIAIHHRVVTRRKSQQSGHSHVKRVVVLDVLFPAHRMHNRSIQLARKFD